MLNRARRDQVNYTSMDNAPILELLSRAAKSELAAVSLWLAQRSAHERITLLIEICREVDRRCVQYAISNLLDEDYPTFDIILRGWNDALGLLLPAGRGLKGIPMMTSTVETRHVAATVLHQLGRYALLSQSVAMLKYGMIEGALKDQVIVLRMTERATTDHFLDQLEQSRLKRLEDQNPNYRAHHPFRKFLLSDIEARIRPLVFPWDSTKGTMVGYWADPEIDNHFLAAITENIVEWRNEAGLHPDAYVGTVRVADLIAVGTLLASFHLKHINFVHAGVKTIPNANYPMSLTIWKPEVEFCASLAEYTGIDHTIVAAALDLVVVRPEQSSYFCKQPTTFIPLALEVADGYLLMPVSSIFKNPFHGIRMLHAEASEETREAIKGPREAWMQEDLYALFQGNRYQRVNGTIKLRQPTGTSTDIDAAIFDWTTGELALFQLKWQDFSTGEIRQQRSKAKNFVERVDKWTAAVLAWIDTERHDGLRRALRIKAAATAPITEIRLFAVGRSVARFRSYGFAPQHTETAVATWPQFIRSRLEIGPAPNVITAIHARLRCESQLTLTRTPMPHKIVAAGQQVIFQDPWIDADEECG